ncbi:MAG: DUF4124 domain-containing protein [Geobacteraceae bacterium]|nr:DUF4124 domain-containing protein [Geobacteraceae bacterium]
MRLIVLFVAVLLAVCSGAALAEIYRYTDSKGELHFVDDIAKVPQKYRRQLENARPLADISTVDATPAPQRRPAEEPPPPRQSASSGSAKVEVYLTSWCGYCKKMVRFLNEKGIPYSAYDIEKDEAAARTYRELGGRGVPVVRVGSRVICGYSPEAVLSSLNEGR